MLRIFSHMVISSYIIFALFPKVQSAIIPSPTTQSTLSAYSTHPNEILPIQPVLIYPKSRKVFKEGRNLNMDDDIIFVKLLKRKGYRPSKQHQKNEDIAPVKELTMKDIFYVKALANGQFSHHRLKVYRLPEFVAISIYRNGEDIHGY